MISGKFSIITRTICLFFTAPTLSPPVYEKKGVTLFWGEFVTPLSQCVHQIWIAWLHPFQK